MDKATFDAVTIGERIGFMTGPGALPRDNLATITAKVEDRWGRHVRVKFDEDGREDTVHGFVTQGIGAYRL